MNPSVEQSTFVGTSLILSVEDAVGSEVTSTGVTTVEAVVVVVVLFIYLLVVTSLSQIHVHTPPTGLDVTGFPLDGLSVAAVCVVDCVVVDVVCVIGGLLGFVTVPGDGVVLGGRAHSG